MGRDSRRQPRPSLKEAAKRRYRKRSAMQEGCEADDRAGEEAGFEWAGGWWRSGLVRFGIAGVLETRKPGRVPGQGTAAWKEPRRGNEPTYRPGKRLKQGTSKIVHQRRILLNIGTNRITGYEMEKANRPKHHQIERSSRRRAHTVSTLHSRDETRTRRL